MALAERNLQVAKARQAAGNATGLDVARAQASVDSARQNLATAQGQTPVLAVQLAALLGLSDLGPVTLEPPPDPPRLEATLEALGRRFWNTSPRSSRPGRRWSTASFWSGSPTTTTPLPLP